MASIGPGWLIIDLRNAQRDARSAADIERENQMLQRAVDSDDIEERRALLRQIREEQQVDPTSRHAPARGRLVLKDRALFDHIVDAWRVFDVLPAIEAQGDGSYRYEREGDFIELGHGDGVLSLHSHAADGAGLGWIDDPAEARFPEADIEFLSFMHPRDPAAYSRLVGGPVESVHCVFWSHFSIGSKGLSMEARYPAAKGGPIADEQSLLTGQPTVDVDSFALVPFDAMLAGAISLSPDMARQNGALHVLIFEIIRGGLFSDATDDDSVVQSFNRCLQGSAGTMLFYLRPAPLMPSVTVELPCDEGAAKEFLQGMENRPGVSLRADQLWMNVGMQQLSMAYRQDRLIMTTVIGGINAVQTSERGFDRREDVQEALAPLGTPTTGHVVQCHEALMQQALPLLGIAGPEIAAQAGAFADALPADASWLHWRYDERGFEASADGALNALLWPVFVPMIAAPIGAN